MRTKNLLLICILIIAVMTVGAVSAAQDANTTETDIAQGLTPEEPVSDVNEGELQDAGGEIASDSGSSSEKSDFNATIYNIKDNYVEKSSVIHTYHLSIKELPKDYPDVSFGMYVDGNFLGNVDPSFFAFNPYKFTGKIHTLTISIPETDKYIAKNLTRTFNMVPVAISLPDKVICGNYWTNTMSIQTSCDDSAKVEFYIDDKLFKQVTLYTTEDSDIWIYELDGLPLGTYNLRVTYLGNSKHPKTSVTKRITVSADITADEDYSIVYTPEGYVGHFYIPRDYKAQPTVTIGNITYENLNTSTLAKNEFEIPVDRRIKPGNHTVLISYPGDDKYPAMSRTVNLHVSLPDIGVGSRTSGFNTYNKTYAYLTLPDDATGNLTVYVDGKLFRTLPVSGKTTVGLDLPIGEHHVYAFYTGDDYAPKAYNNSLDINPEVVYVDAYHGEIPYIVINTNPDANGTWTYKVYQENTDLGGSAVLVDNATFQTVDGKYKIVFSKMKQDFNIVNNVVLTYDDGSYKFSDTYQFRLKQYPLKMSVKDLTMYYMDGSALKVYVYDEYGLPATKGKVIFEFKTHSVSKTVKNGVVSLPIKFNPGTYKVSIAFDRTMVGLSAIIYAQKKITVKKILSLSTVKVKKSAKKLVLTAKLAKKLKGKLITFKFNGKTIKAKTNAKGIAKATVNKATLKKLKVGKKVAYSATYCSETVKKTAKVLK